MQAGCYSGEGNMIGQIDENEKAQHVYFDSPGSGT